MQKKVFLWRCFVERKTKETFRFAKLLQVLIDDYNYHKSDTAASLAQAIKTLNGWM